MQTTPNIPYSIQCNSVNTELVIPATLNLLDKEVLQLISSKQNNLPVTYLQLCHSNRISEDNNRTIPLYSPCIEVTNLFKHFLTYINNQSYLSSEFTYQRSTFVSSSFISFNTIQKIVGRNISFTIDNNCFILDETGLRHAVLDVLKAKIAYKYLDENTEPYTNYKHISEIANSTKFDMGRAGEYYLNKEEYRVLYHILHSCSYSDFCSHIIMNP